MGNCRFCGQSAGWLKDTHDACKIKAQAGVTEIGAVISNAVGDVMQDKAPDVQSAIEKIKVANIVPDDAARKAIIESWSVAASDAALKEPLSQQRELALLKLYEDAGLSAEQMKKTEGFRAVVFSVLLWAIVNNDEDFYTNAMVSQNPFNLKSGEIPIAYFGSVVYSQEATTKSYEGGYGGLSVRVLPGVYSHFGGFKGQPVETTAMKEVDYGGLLLTTRSLYFGGQHTTFCVPFSSVLAFRPRPDGIGVSRSANHGKPEVFSMLMPGADGNAAPASPTYGWFLFNAVHFLAAK